MRNGDSADARASMRDKLIAVIEASDVDLGGELGEDTSLIKSGKLDSLGLFNVASFIEREVGCQVDITAFDLAEEWDTIGDILNFITALRRAQ
jgi:acyl carrier protein